MRLAASGRFGGVFGQDFQIGIAKYLAWMEPTGERTDQGPIKTAPVAA